MQNRILTELLIRTNLNSLINFNKKKLSRIIMNILNQKISKEVEHQIFLIKIALQLSILHLLRSFLQINLIKSNKTLNQVREVILLWITKIIFKSRQKAFVTLKI